VQELHLALFAHWDANNAFRQPIALIVLFNIIKMLEMYAPLAQTTVCNAKPIHFAIHVKLTILSMAQLRIYVCIAKAH